MGDVFLTNGHYGLNSYATQADHSRWVRLKPEWLKLPLLGADHRPLDDAYAAMHCAMLRGLSALSGFDAAVSHSFLNSDEGPRVALPPTELWGEIFFGPSDRPCIVVKFTSVNRTDSPPFNHLSQWLVGTPEGSAWAEARFQESERVWSSSARWEQFFTARIKSFRDQLRSAATLSAANKAAQQQLGVEIDQRLAV